MSSGVDRVQALEQSAREQDALAVNYHAEAIRPQRGVTVNLDVLEQLRALTACHRALAREQRQLVRVLRAQAGVEEDSVALPVRQVAP